MEEDKSFKALFLENQHAHYSSYMGTVDTDTTPMRELRRMASCAFMRFGKTGKGSNNPSVMALGDRDALQLEGAEYRDRKPKGFKAGPQKEGGQHDDDKQYRPFNKRRDSERPRTPPPARGGAPKSPQTGRVERRVSFEKKGGSPRPGRKASPHPDGGRTPPRASSPYASRWSHSPARGRDRESEDTTEEERRMVRELLRRMRADKTTTREVLCATTRRVSPPRWEPAAGARAVDVRPSTMSDTPAPAASVTRAGVGTASAREVTSGGLVTWPTDRRYQPTMSECRSDDSDFVLGNIVRRGHSGKPHVLVTVAGVRDCEALVDTGSTTTVMSRSAWEQVRRAAESRGRVLAFAPGTVRVPTLAGVEIPFKGLALIDLSVGFMTVQHPVLVADVDSFPLLLGCDLLNRIGAEFDLSDWTLRTTFTSPVPLEALEHLNVDSEGGDDDGVVEPVDRSVAGGGHAVRGICVVTVRPFQAELGDLSIQRGVGGCDEKAPVPASPAMGDPPTTGGVAGRAATRIGARSLGGDDPDRA
uniref:Aspartyl protease n=1 Tax=Nothobranchius furzeri TaxID=105023 RepID=A0A1A8A999_NOTFU